MQKNPKYTPPLPLAFSYFTSNGETGLHLALSIDGLNWQSVNNGESLFRSEVGDENLMRDPFILPDPDGSGYHCLWTTGWRGRSIGYAFSPDLITWSEGRALSVLDALPGGRNAWAPEAIFDETTGEYLIFFSVMQPEQYEGHRMYGVRTKDFHKVSPAEMFYDPGFSVIDAHLIQDPARDRWVMIVKDEREGHKHLFACTGPSPLGPWSVSVNPVAGHLTEGATSFKTKEGWIILYDAYGDHEYRAFTSKDLNRFDPLSAPLHFPGRVRHGTVFPLTESVYEELYKLH